MPQMAPMWWMTIMVITSATMLYTIMYSYFNTYKNMNINNINQKKMKNFIWKW